jgi:SAM-dependent methyltransferase
VLELGCGNGRNATYLAGLGCDVDAVDFSAEALNWAAQRASSTGTRVNFQCCSIFDADIDPQSYDLVYDSGCFHHIAPHRRKDYLELVGSALKPGGNFGLVCLRPEGGSGLTDQQVYEHASLAGGLGYSEHQLRTLWNQPPFDLHVLHQMQTPSDHGERFGRDFLWVMLAAKETGGR